MTRQLLSIGHSYVVEINRRLPQELQAQSGGRWEVTVIAPDKFTNTNDGRSLACRVPPDEPVRVIQSSIRSPQQIHFFRYGKELQEVLGSQKWDLVHVWEEPYIAAGWQLVRKAAKHAPVVFWSAQNISKRYPPPFSLMERATVNRCAGWLSCGRTTLETLRSRPGYASKPNIIAPLGVDTDQFRLNLDYRNLRRQQLGWSDSTLVIGYLGRLVSEKGLRVLMQALERVSAGWRLLMLGNGPLADEIRAWSRPFKDRVALCEGIGHSEVPSYINAMDLLVAPSHTTPKWREQQGRMITEAFACGVPVVGSDSGEIPYVIGDAGIVTPEGNVDALANAIQRVLTDEAERKRLAAAGLRRVKENFTWPQIAGNTLKFFDEIVQQ